MVKAPYLTIRATPLDGESWRGFLLRLAEANHYGNPSHVLQFHGNTIRLRTFPTHRDIEHVARLVRCGTDTLRDLGGTVVKGRAVRTGISCKPVALRFLDLNNPKVCPRCLEGGGHLRSLWDVAPLLACPVHGCLLVGSCPGCGSPLRWSRSAAGHCCPAAPLATAASAAPDPRVFDMVMALACAIEPGRHRWPEGLPPEAARLDAGQLLTMIAGVGVEGFEGNVVKLLATAKRDAGVWKQILLSAFSFLAHWPEGVGPFVDNMFAADGSSDKLARIDGLGPGWKKFVRWSRDPAFGFARKEVWKCIIARSPALIKAVTRAGPQQFLSASDAITEFGVSRCWLKAWVGACRLSVVMHQVGARSRKLFRRDELKALLHTLRQSPRPPTRRGKPARFPTPRVVAAPAGFVSIDETAARLGVHLAAVNAIASADLVELAFEAGAGCVRETSIHALLASVDASVAGEVPGRSTRHGLKRGELIRLTSRSGQPEELARRIRAVLDGRLRCVRVPGLCGLAVFAVKADELKAFQGELPRATEALSAKEVCVSLGCSPREVKELARTGYLTQVSYISTTSGKISRAHVRISHESLTLFERDFVVGSSLGEGQFRSAKFYRMLTTTLGPPVLNEEFLKVWRRPALP